MVSTLMDSPSGAIKATAPIREIGTTMAGMRV